MGISPLRGHQEKCEIILKNPRREGITLSGTYLQHLISDHTFIYDSFVSADIRASNDTFTRFVILGADIARIEHKYRKKKHYSRIWSTFVSSPHRLIREAVFGESWVNENEEGEIYDLQG